MSISDQFQTPLLSLSPDDPDRAVLIGLATAEAEAALDKPVALEPAAVDRCGRWGFVLAHLREQDGSPLSFADTPLAEAAASGGASDLVAALYRLVLPAQDEATLSEEELESRPDEQETELETGPDAEAQTGAEPDGSTAGTDAESKGEWVIIDHCIAPADVAWLEWPAVHGVPGRLLGVG